MEFFENRLKRRAFGGFQRQATGEDIWRVSIKGYWGEHFKIFEDRSLGVYLEVFKDRLLRRSFGGFENRILGRTFGGFREHANVKYI